MHEIENRHATAESPSAERRQAATQASKVAQGDHAAKVHEVQHTCGASEARQLEYREATAKACKGTHGEGTAKVQEVQDGHRAPKT
jgi:hypothetical protein